MGKIGIIIEREFNQRVRKRSFIVTTIITPILLLGLMFAPVVIASLEGRQVREIAVVDLSGLVAGGLGSDGYMSFVQTDAPLDSLRADGGARYFGVLVIGEDVVADPSDVKLYTFGPSTMALERGIASRIARIIEGEKLRSHNIDNLPQVLAEVKTDVRMQTFRLDATGSQTRSSSIAAMGAAYLFGFMIYMFVFMYGAMVMQGVIEEKSSKVLEIMVSSVKPFELMLGKILGIAAVALTQFVIWMVFLAVAGLAVMQFLLPDAAAVQGAGMVGMMPEAALGVVDLDAAAVVQSLTDIGFLMRIIGGFVVYFVGGYLLYAAFFAAIGSAVDNVNDTQQLQLPVTIPLILSMVLLFGVMNEPNGSIAVWFSIIPFTSPIIMMARIPYGVPVWEMVLSVVLLYGSFVFMVWVAGRIYRVGIFMYGKKPSFRELVRWISYRE